MISSTPSRIRPQRPEGSPPGTAVPRANISVLYVDDDRMVAESMIAALERIAPITVVGTAGTISALEGVVARSVDVAVVDYRLADGSGADAVRVIRRRFPRAAIIATSGLPGPAPLLEMVAAGADGYVEKSRPLTELLSAITRAAAGELSLEAEEIALLEQRSRDLRAREALPPPSSRPTVREQQVLGLIAAGFSSAEISERLVLGDETIRSHIKSLRRKAGAHSRLELVTIARSAGWLHDEPPRAAGRRGA
jgi:DNA-binding NarL/FixJ family response regulator